MEKSHAGRIVLLLAIGCAEPSFPKHLLLVSVDTLRADHLGLCGYPRDTSPTIDELGASGVVFENAIVQWPVTTPAMVSMFSGTYPHENGIVIFAYPQHVPDESIGERRGLFGRSDKQPL